MVYRSHFWVSCCQLIGWTLVVFAFAFLSSVAVSSHSLEWYHTLQLPVWGPPDWLFGPVWTVLYFFMALSAWLVSRDSTHLIEKRRAYFLFFVQLFLNALWTPLFFGIHRPGLALVALLVLLVFIVLTGISFAKIRPIAGKLFLPYLIWSLFACMLNSVIWWQN